MGESDVASVSILIGIDRHSADTGVFGGSDDSHRDFTTVCDEELLDSRHDHTA